MSSSPPPVTPPVRSAARSSARRDLLAREALAQIPKLLTLQDRNPHSPTYGCFDRNFWHYKIIDFPSGMSQEFVLPLALAYDTDCPGNDFYRSEALIDWVKAGIAFAARSAHRDGSCDDYFPYERAGGAAAFSLLACLDSYTLLRLEGGELLGFFERRADWLAGHHESGVLANHQALIVLCLELASRLLATDRWNEAKARRLERVLSWQNEEGWFREYEGCDPGYQTLTISLLARLCDLSPSDELRSAITRAVKFVGDFVHPDGSFGGEYTSRNTYNYFPHGFELAGKWMPGALAVNDRFLDGLERGHGACYADDHIIGHHTWNYLLAWRDFVASRPPLLPPSAGQKWFRNAGLLVDRRGDRQLYVALNKGGAFKLFHGDRLLVSDTQFSVQLREAGRRNAVGHLVDDYQVEVEEDRITVRGRLGYAKQTQMTTPKLVVLRAVMLTVGRFFPNLVRKLLQRMLITGKKPAPFRFCRTFRRDGESWSVADELRADRWSDVATAGIGASQTSIYVVMSRTFQAGQLQSWLDLTDRVRELESGEPLTLERRF